MIYIDYKNIVNVLDLGDIVYVDDGLISLKVTEKGPTHLTTGETSFSPLPPLISPPPSSLLPLLPPPTSLSSPFPPFLSTPHSTHTHFVTARYIHVCRFIYFLNL